MDGSHSLLIRTAVWHSDAARGPSTPSFDHLVGGGEHRGGRVEAERLRRLEVDHQLVFGRRLHRQVSRVGALEDAVDVARRSSVLVLKIRAEGNQAASLDERSIWIDRGQTVAC